MKKNREMDLVCMEGETMFFRYVIIVDCFINEIRVDIVEM